ncbi:hypothetical protein, partial [Brevibacillus parabrevis]|uniref:hypothetical protein n=1 Tax=Brevibacillus parabrevis TaxID=54914 RepID=UPI0028D0A84E
MVQLFICPWCGYVEEKELPEESEAGIVTCACCNTAEVEGVFAHGTAALLRKLPSFLPACESCQQTKRIVLTNALEFLRIGSIAKHSSYPERWRVWPDEARQP